MAFGGARTVAVLFRKNLAKRRKPGVFTQILKMTDHSKYVK